MQLAWILFRIAAVIEYLYTFSENYCTIWLHKAQTIRVCVVNF